MEVFQNKVPISMLICYMNTDDTRMDIAQVRSRWIKKKSIYITEE